MTTTPAMPELPEPDYWSMRDDDTPLYTADQMRAYALAALQPQPQAQPQPAAAVSDEEIWGLWDSQERSVAGWACPVKFARATLALRPQAVPMTWELLTDERIKSEDFSGMYWLALKNGTVTTGCYQWRQGHNPYGFNTEEQGRISASDVSHIAPLAEPAHPGITAQGAQGGEG